MKRLVSILMVVVLMVSTLSISAFAAEIPVEHLVEENTASARAREVQDLGLDGSIRLVSTTCDPDIVLRSYYNYTTNSTEINVKLKSNIKGTIQIVLRDATTGGFLQQHTVELTTSYKTKTFGGLKANIPYYITFENVDTQIIIIEGYIQA